MSEKTNLRSKLPWGMLVIAVAAFAGGILILSDNSGTGGRRTASHAAAAELKGKQAPDFDVPALGGGRIKLSEQTGKVVILDFWSITCTPCIEANKHLDGLYGDYGKMGLHIIGLSIDQSPEMVEQFLKLHPVKYPVGIATEEIIKSYGGVFSIPQTLIIDRKGKIVKKYDGFSALSAHDMDRFVKKLLKAES